MVAHTWLKERWSRPVEIWNLKKIGSLTAMFVRGILGVGEPSFDALHRNFGDIGLAIKVSNSLPVRR
jgi:hypothetical protein